MDTNIKIMTSNIWGDYFGNPVEVREMGLFDTYMRYDPDILGMQEATVAWGDSRLFKLLCDKYTFVPVDKIVAKWYEDNADDEGVKDLRLRGKSAEQNFVPLVYKSDKYDLVDYGWHHFTDTIDPSKCVTWALLCDKKTDKKFGVCATHFWWMTGEEHDRLRDKNAFEMLNIMKEIRNKYECPVFAFGDFNCFVGSTAFGVLMNGGCTNMQKAARETSEICSIHGDPVRQDDGTYKGYTTDKTSEYSIDHIICLGEVDVLKYDIITDVDALDATDHSPVMAEVVI